MDSVRIDCTEAITDSLNQIAHLQQQALPAAECQSAVARLYAALSPTAQRALAVASSLQCGSRTLAV